MDHGREVLLSAARPATTVYLGGRVYALEGSAHPSGAIAVVGDTIAALGEDRELRSAFPNAPVVNLGGRTVLPGFTDAHCHWLGVALGATRLVISPSDAVDAIVAKVAAAARDRPDGTWILGRGWDHSAWQGWPTAADLDRATVAHPVALTRKDGHAVWANTSALALAGVAGASVPQGGSVLRDESGEPTGVLLENAMRLVTETIPPASADEREAALASSWPIAWREGITGCHDMGYGPSAVFRDVAALRDKGLLGLRFVWYAPRDALAEAIALGLKSGLGDPWIRFGGVKLFLDGTLGSRTARLLAPYEDAPSTGLATLEADEFRSLVADARAAGMSVAAHAIGDAAVRSALDEMERGGPGGAWTGRLPDRIEHAQLVDPSDLARFAQAGIVASMQPVHAVVDAPVAEVAWGPRTARAYPWRSLLESGARLVFGSDAPVETPSVIAGLAAATSRAGWHPEQTVDMQAALRAYTIAPAHASGQGDLLGSLAPGKLADLVVLDGDPFTSRSAEELPGVAATMIAGRWVWRRFDTDLDGPMHTGSSASLAPEMYS